VRDFFRTRFYLGRIVYDGAEYAGQHEPLVNELVWERVQRRRATKPPPRFDRRTLLQGWVRCTH